MTKIRSDSGLTSTSTWIEDTTVSTISNGTNKETENLISCKVNIEENAEHECEVYLKDPIRKLLKAKTNWSTSTINKTEKSVASKNQIIVEKSFLKNLTRDKVKDLLKFDEMKDAANKKPNENPYWHEFLRSVVEFDNRIKSKFNGRKSFAISTYGSLKYLTNQGGALICDGDTSPDDIKMDTISNMLAENRRIMKYKKGDRVPVMAFKRNHNESHMNSQIEYLSEVSANEELTSQEFRLMIELFQNELCEDTDYSYFAFSNPPHNPGTASKF